LRLSAFRLRFFLSFFPFVMPGLDPGIHAEVALANASTGICLLQSFAWSTA
jgi:phenylalanyl-tRNA synthetase alpha subunit